MNLYQTGIIKGKAEGKVEGKAEFIIEILEDIGIVSDELRHKIMAEKDESILSKWRKLATKAKGIDNFIDLM